MHPIRCFASVIGCLLLSACSTSQTTLYQLPKPSHVPDKALQSPALAVEPIGLSGYLHRPQLATRQSALTLTINDHQQWAGPLSGMIQHYLSQTLQANNVNAWAVLKSDKTPNSQQLYVYIERFDFDQHNQVVLKGRWNILGASGQLEHNHRFAFKAHSQPTRAAQLTTMASLLDKLATQIEGSIKQPAAASDNSAGYRPLPY